jgi:formamidopyrimidine-DNA glycosylase
VPELPEVENVRIGLSPLLGTTLNPVMVSSYPKFASAASAAGVVEAIDRRGKWLVLHLSRDAHPVADLVVHLGMTGRLVLDENRPTGPHLHALWRVDRSDAEGGLWLGFFDPRRFGRLVCTPPGDHTSLPGLSTLGPDATGAADVVAALAALSTSTRPVKTVLLDQSVLAGAGNIYCDEALFESRIHPATPCSRLTTPDRTALAQALSESLLSSIAAGGTTFRDYRRPDGTSGSNVHKLRCYGRAGLPCLRCSSVITTTRVAGRSTSFCPTCQPPR